MEFTLSTFILKPINGVGHKLLWNCVYSNEDCNLPDVEIKKIGNKFNDRDLL